LEAHPRSLLIHSETGFVVLSVGFVVGLSIAERDGIGNFGFSVGNYPRPLFNFEAE